MSVSERQALDVHVNRKRFREEGLNKNGKLKKDLKNFIPAFFGNAHPFNN
jgi:hypothetical protein